MIERYHQVARSYLVRHGYTGKKLEEVLNGFDLRAPTYEQSLDPKTTLYQFVRRVAHESPIPRLGNWFCLPGASMRALAIISGGAGRAVAKVHVDYPLLALEGTAAPQPRQWSWSGGGPGGATQIFVPEQFLMTHFSVVGYDTDFKDIVGP